MEMCYADKIRAKALSLHPWGPALAISPLYPHYFHNRLELIPTFTELFDYVIKAISACFL